MTQNTISGWYTTPPAYREIYTKHLYKNHISYLNLRNLLYLIGEVYTIATHRSFFNNFQATYGETSLELILQPYNLC